MSVIRDPEGGAPEKSGVASVEDLDVFRRAYAISLDLHLASLKFPKIEQFGGPPIKFGGPANRSVRTLPKVSASNDSQIWNSNAIC
jgi:hypothetical protein